MNWKTVGVCAAALVAIAVPSWAQGVTDVRFGSGPPVKVVAPKGFTPSGYSSFLYEAYATILTSNQSLNRYISPSDIVILCPPATTAVLNGKRPTTSGISGKGGQTSTPIPSESRLSPTGTYIIYVEGRRFLTVDAAMARANGMSSSAALATKLARQYMQRFPRECFRPPTLPALAGVPANPPLRLTTNLEQCVPPDVRGRVIMFGKGLFNTATVLPDGSTGPDKAAVLTRKTTQIMNNLDLTQPIPVVAVKDGAEANVKVGDKVLYTLNDFDAKSNGFRNAMGFAKFLVLEVTKRLQAKAQPATPPAVPDAVPVPAPVDKPADPAPAPPTVPAPVPAPTR